MNKKPDNQDHFNVMREIQKQPKTSQRDLAEQLGFSLGKLNYCLKALQEKGLIKIKNFEKNPNKLNYIYVLTPKGIAEKTKLTINFMKRKMQEYDKLKSELNTKLKNILSTNNTAIIFNSVLVLLYHLRGALYGFSLYCFCIFLLQIWVWFFIKVIVQE